MSKVYEVKTKLQQHATTGGTHLDIDFPNRRVSITGSVDCPDLAILPLGSDDRYYVVAVPEAVETTLLAISKANPDVKSWIAGPVAKCKAMLNACKDNYRGTGKSIWSFRTWDSAAQFRPAAGGASGTPGPAGAAPAAQSAVPPAPSQANPHASPPVARKLPPQTTWASAPSAAPTPVVVATPAGPSVQAPAPPPMPLATPASSVPAVAVAAPPAAATQAPQHAPSPAVQAAADPIIPPRAAAEDGPSMSAADARAILAQASQGGEMDDGDFPLNVEPAQMHPLLPRPKEHAGPVLLNGPGRIERLRVDAAIDAMRRHGILEPPPGQLDVLVMPLAKEFYQGPKDSAAQQRSKAEWNAKSRVEKDRHLGLESKKTTTVGSGRFQVVIRDAREKAARDAFYQQRAIEKAEKRAAKAGRSASDPIHVKNEDGQYEDLLTVDVRRSLTLGMNCASGCAYTLVHPERIRQDIASVMELMILSTKKRAVFSPAMVFLSWLQAVHDSTAAEDAWLDDSVITSTKIEGLFMTLTQGYDTCPKQVSKEVAEHFGLRTQPIGGLPTWAHVVSKQENTMDLVTGAPASMAAYHVCYMLNVLSIGGSCIFQTAVTASEKLSLLGYSFNTIVTSKDRPLLSLMATSGIIGTIQGSLQSRTSRSLRVVAGETLQLDETVGNGQISTSVSGSRIYAAHAPAQFKVHLAVLYACGVGADGKMLGGATFGPSRMTLLQTNKIVIMVGDDPKALYGYLTMTDHGGFARGLPALKQMTEELAAVRNSVPRTVAPVEEAVPVAV